jgi:hypothetical protein
MESVDTLSFQINELKIKIDAEKYKREMMESKVRQFVTWLENEKKIYVKHALENLGIKHKAKKEKPRRVSSVIHSRDSFNESKWSNNIPKNQRSGAQSEADFSSNNKRYNLKSKISHSYVSPEPGFSGHTTYINFNAIPSNRNCDEQSIEYINLRRDLKKETELVSKLKKLMMDTSHPSLYEFKATPLVKHVWRWVKKLVQDRMESTQYPYIK